MIKKGISIGQLKARKFTLLDFEGDWADKIGQPEQGFRAMYYGPSGSGKTTEVMRLAWYLSQFGKVLYNSWEEGVSKTVQDTVVSIGIPDDAPIYLYEDLDYDEMVEKAKRARYRFIIIDSIQYMGFNYSHYQDFNSRFKSKGLILISQVNGSGRPRGGEQILHAVDIKCNIDQGVAEYRSRYLKGHKKVNLFKKKPQYGEKQLAWLHDRGRTNGDLSSLHQATSNPNGHES